MNCASRSSLKERKDFVNTDRFNNVNGIVVNNLNNNSNSNNVNTGYNC